MGDDQHKFQEGYEPLAQGHGRTNKGLPNLEEKSHHGYHPTKRDLNRTHMYRKSLPLT